MAPRSRVWPVPATTAGVALQADHDRPNQPIEGVGGSVVAFRNGPGDNAPNALTDLWADPIMYDVPHQGLELGDALRMVNPARTPPEGHGGFDIPASDYGPFINASTRTLTEYISDWNASTAAKGCSGSFDGAHVVIQRIRPGSDRGYMPTQMFPPNQERALPGPWDANITVGGGSLDTLAGGAG